MQTQDGGLGPRLQGSGQGKSGNFPRSVTLKLSSSLRREEGCRRCSGLENIGALDPRGSLWWWGGLPVVWTEDKKALGDQRVGLAGEQ